MDFEVFIIHVILGILARFIKNPNSAKAQRLKTDLLAVRDEISALYPAA